MPGKILIVDDEARLRQTLAIILSKAGYSVMTAEDANVALSLLEKDTFDLIILDLKLPEIDGITLLDQIRSTYNQIPVLILTAHASVDSAIDALRLRASDYILKPVEPTVLLTRVRKITGEQKGADLKYDSDSYLSSMVSIYPTVAPNSHTSVKEDGTNSRYVRAGSLRLNVEEQSVEQNGKYFKLAPASFAYLLVLVRHSPAPVSYADLVGEAAHPTGDGGAPENEAKATARWHIHQLRQLLEENPDRPELIRTVRSIGYCLVTEIGDKDKRSR